MAIALATSPALVTDESDGSNATATFSPVAQSLLVALAVGADDSGDGMAVSGGSLSWTRRILRNIGGFIAVEIWTAPCPAGASNITVTLTSSGFVGNFASALKVDVFTGADLTTPAGASGQGASTTNNATVSGYTATVVGSRGVAAAMDGNQLGLPSSTDDESAFDLVNLDGMALRKASNTASLTTVTFNLDAGGASAAAWEWAALEILPVADPFVAGPGRMLGQAVPRAAFY